jgi:hypothetical protein
MSRLSLQERELESENNIFIINSSSNTITKILLSGCIRSGRVRYRVISGFGSYQVGSSIGSSSVGSFRVTGRIRSGRVSDRSVSDYFRF